MATTKLMLLNFDDNEINGQIFWRGGTERSYPVPPSYREYTIYLSLCLDRLVRVNRIGLDINGAAISFENNL